jgi:membrane carboxypeptidase/penicillin-binding protein PbpC
LPVTDVSKEEDADTHCRYEARFEQETVKPSTSKRNSNANLSILGGGVGIKWREIVRITFGNLKGWVYTGRVR